MAAEIIGLLVHPFLTNIVLPFLLIFVVVYAILERTKVLGEKRYANLIVAIVIGFIWIGAQTLVGFTIKLIPLFAAMIIILLGYFLVFGFIGIAENKGLKITLGILFGIAILVSVAWAAGLFDMISPANWGPDVLALIIFFVIFTGAIVLVVTTSAKGKGK